MIWTIIKCHERKYIYCLELINVPKYQEALIRSTWNTTYTLFSDSKCIIISFLDQTNDPPVFVSLINPTSQPIEQTRVWVTCVYNRYLHFQSISVYLHHPRKSNISSINVIIIWIMMPFTILFPSRAVCNLPTYLYPLETYNFTIANLIFRHLLALPLNLLLLHFPFPTTYSQQCGGLLHAILLK